MGEVAPPDTFRHTFPHTFSTGDSSQTFLPGGPIDTFTSIDNVSGLDVHDKSTTFADSSNSKSSSSSNQSGVSQTSPSPTSEGVSQTAPSLTSEWASMPTSISETHSSHRTIPIALIAGGLAGAVLLITLGILLYWRRTVRQNHSRHNMVEEVDNSHGRDHATLRDIDPDALALDLDGLSTVRHHPPAYDAAILSQTRPRIAASFAPVSRKAGSHTNQANTARSHGLNQEALPTAVPSATLMTNPGEVQRLHDHITALEAEVERLRAENADMAMADLNSLPSYDSRSARNNHIDTLQAEVERLRSETMSLGPSDLESRSLHATDADYETQVMTKAG